MGHKQLPTPIKTDNATALGFVTKYIFPKATKSTDMRYWLICDRLDCQQLYIIEENENKTGETIGQSNFARPTTEKKAKHLHSRNTIGRTEDKRRRKNSPV